ALSCPPPRPAVSAALSLHDALPIWTRSRVRWCLLERRRRMIVGINRPIRLTVWRPSASLAVLRVWMVESFDTADLVEQREHGVETLAGDPMRAQHDLLHAGVADDGKCFEGVVELACDGVVDEVVQRYTEDVGKPCEQAKGGVVSSACSQRADVVRGDRDALLGEGRDNAGRCVELGAVWGERHRAEEQVESLCEVRNVFGG